MIFKNIRLKNIRSYKETEIKFPEGAVLLAGDVGSGKTTVLLAIEYALFGLQPGQRGSSLLSNSEEYGEVSLEIDIDGIKVVIDRGLKRNAKSINQDFAAITINDIRFESSVTEVKQKIIELLNYPMDFVRKNNLVYRYTVYTPQEEMKQIIIEDTEVRLDVLRHVFGVDKYKRIQDNAQRIIMWIREESRTLQIESALLDVKRNELDSNLKFIKILESKILVKEEEIKQSKNAREIQQKEVDSLIQLVTEKENFKKEIEKSAIMANNKQEQISRILKDIKEIDESIGNTKIQPEYTKLSTILEQISKTKKTIELLDKEYLDLNSKNHSLDILKNQELSKKSRVFQMNFCPTCLQDVPEVHKHNIMNATESSIKEIEKNKMALASEITRIETELKKQKEDLKNLEHERITIEIQNVKQENIDKYIKKKEELLKNKESIEKDLVLINEHIDSLKKHSLEYTKFENLLKIKKEELSKILESEQKKEIEFAEIRKETELINKEINKLEKEIYIGERSRQKLISMLDIENWLSNNFSNLIKFTEKNILIALRKEFTKIFNKWFSVLTTDSFEVYLDENFSPVIVHNEFELDYQFLSGGERTAVALAYRLALNQLINSILSKIKTQDVIILDEPTEGFSEQQLDKVRDMLQEMHLKQLLIVSHESKMEGFVDHVIRFRKVNGVSTVVVENDKV
ncbi:AAA family ATPase [Candidatus Pacearchaeota archaeon]|nr:AAA family ATPase [Candidatus Pacearchaeota archaeon]